MDNHDIHYAPTAERLQTRCGEMLTDVRPHPREYRYTGFLRTAKRSEVTCPECRRLLYNDRWSKPRLFVVNGQWRVTPLHLRRRRREDWCKLADEWAAQQNTGGE